MAIIESNTVLDMDQLRSVTMDDEELMRDIVSALIDDTSQQLGSLAEAVRTADGVRTVQLAHYSKGACANVGAQSAATVLQRIEQKAKLGDWAACASSLGLLAGELERLKLEADTLTLN